MALAECLSAVLVGAVHRGFDGPDGVSKDEALEYAGILAERVQRLSDALGPFDRNADGMTFQAGWNAAIEVVRETLDGAA